MTTFHVSQFRKVGVFTSALIIALAMVVIAGNFTASQSSGTSVTTCYNKKTGAMRYLVKGVCKKTESTLKIDNVGTPGSQGATGSTGAAGGNGYSVGLSVYSPLDENAPILRLNASTPDLVFRSNDPVAAGGRANADRLILSSSKLVQVSAHLSIYQITGDNAATELGKVSCSLFHGAHNASISNFTHISSIGYLDVSETSNASSFIGSMSLVGFVTASVDSDFAVQCDKFGVNPSDVRIGEVTLNAVAIG